MCLLFPWARWQRDCFLGSSASQVGSPRSAAGVESTSEGFLEETVLRRTGWRRKAAGREGAEPECISGRALERQRPTDPTGAGGRRGSVRDTVTTGGTGCWEML